MAVLTFKIDAFEELLEVHVFDILEYTGEPEETDEMCPKWFKIADIPYQEMWADDYLWLPKFLKNEKLIQYFHFKNETEMLSYSLETVESSE